MIIPCEAPPLVHVFVIFSHPHSCASDSLIKGRENWRVAVSQTVRDRTKVAIDHH